MNIRKRRSSPDIRKIFSRLSRLNIAELLVRFNIVCTFIWILLGYPSLTWWKNSILWVILISLWANIVGHFSAYIAGRAELAQQKGHNLTEADRQWLEERFARRGS